MGMEQFDQKIRKDIKNWSYPIWFITKDNSIDCKCVDFTTKQAKCDCPKCFGLGKKVKLRRVNAAHQCIDVSIRGDGIGTGEKNVVSTYYTLQKVPATEGDYILDGETLDVVHHIYPMRSNHTEPVYYKYETAPKKNDVEITKRLLQDCIRKAGYEC